MLRFVGLQYKITIKYIAICVFKVSKGSSWIILLHCIPKSDEIKQKLWMEPDLSTWESKYIKLVLDPISILGFNNFTWWQTLMLLKKNFSSWEEWEFKCESWTFTLQGSMKRPAWHHLSVAKNNKTSEWLLFKHDGTRKATYLLSKAVIRSEKTPTDKEIVRWVVFGRWKLTIYHTEVLSGTATIHLW